MRALRQWRLVLTCALLVFWLVDAARRERWGEVAFLAVVAVVVGALVLVSSRDPEGTRYVRARKLRGSRAVQADDTTAG